MIGYIVRWLRLFKYITSSINYYKGGKVEDEKETDFSFAGKQYGAFYGSMR